MPDENLGLEFREASIEDFKRSTERKRYAVTSWRTGLISGDGLLDAARATAKLTHLAKLADLDSSDPLTAAQAQCVHQEFELANRRMAMALLAEMWLRSHHVAGDDLSLIRVAVHEAKLKDDLGPVLSLL